MASSDPDLYWKDTGIAFYVINFKRDIHGNILYRKDATGLEFRNCPSPVPFNTGPPCEHDYIHIENKKGYSPVLSTDGTGYSGFGSTDAVTLLYDYISPPSVTGMDIAHHLYTTVPFKEGSSLMSGYRLDGVGNVGGIFVPLSPLHLPSSPDHI